MDPNETSNSSTIEQRSTAARFYVPKSTCQVTSPCGEMLRYLNRRTQVFPNKKSVRRTPRAFSTFASDEDEILSNRRCQALEIKSLYDLETASNSACLMGLCKLVYKACRTSKTVTNGEEVVVGSTVMLQGSPGVIIFMALTGGCVAVIERRE